MVLAEDIMKQYVAYKGTKFTIEWYFDEQGSSPAQAYFLDMSAGQREKTLYLFKVMGDLGRIMNEEKFRYEGHQVFEFKITSHRLLCFFFIGSKIIVTNAFEKKTAKLPTTEKARALLYAMDYKERVTRGTYYE